MQPLGSERQPGPPAGGLGTGDGLNLRPGSRGTGDGRRSPGRRWSPWLTGLLMAVLLAAVYFQQMSAAGAIAAAVFGGAALFFAERLVRSLDRGERASFESAWGGLGGGLGGWRLTTPLVYLVATAVFGILLMVVAVQELPPGRAGETPVTAEDEQQEGGGEASPGEGEADGEDGDAGEPVGDTDEPEDEAEGAAREDGSEPEDDEGSDEPATAGEASVSESGPATEP